jgi:hypothetical protein
MVTKIIAMPSARTGFTIGVIETAASAFGAVVAAIRGNRPPGRSAGPLARRGQRARRQPQRRNGPGRYVGGPPPE